MFNIITEVFCGNINGRDIWECTGGSTSDSLNEARGEARECLQIERLYSRSTYGENKRFRAIIKETGEIIV